MEKKFKKKILAIETLGRQITYNNKRQKKLGFVN